jgi:hypothetical protein
LLCGEQKSQNPSRAKCTISEIRDLHFQERRSKRAFHEERIARGSPFRQHSWDDWAWHKELSEWKPVHTLIPIIHVARCGEEIGKFDNERDILSGLRDGSLLMDDYYWCEGMSEWKHLSALEISNSPCIKE